MSDSKKPLSLKVNFCWALIGNIVYTACQFLMLVMLAKLGTPSIVGVYTLALSLTAPIVVFAYLNLRSIQATDINKEYSFAQYFTLRVLFLLLAGIVIIGVAIFYPVPVHTKLAIMILGGAKLVEAISDIIHGLLQQHERMDKAGLSMGIKGIIQLVAIILSLHLTGDVVWACSSILLATCFMLLFVDIPFYFWLKKIENFAKISLLCNSSSYLRKMLCVDTKKIKALFIMVLPMGIMALLDSLYMNVPRYVLERQVGIKAVGYYSAIAYLMFLANFIVTATGQSLTPKLARTFHESKKEFVKLTFLMVLFGCGLGAAGIAVSVFFGKVLLSIFYSPDYAQHNDVFVLVMVSACIYYMASFVWYSSIAARILKPQPWILVIAIIATFLTSFYTIGHYGIMGAAWGLFAGVLVRLVGGILVLIISLSINKKQTLYELSENVESGANSVN